MVQIGVVLVAKVVISNSLESSLPILNLLKSLVKHPYSLLFCSTSSSASPLLFPLLLISSASAQGLATFLSSKICPPPIFNSINKITPENQNKHKPQFTCHIVCKDTWCNNRRHVLANFSVSILAFNYGLPLAWESNVQEEKDESLVGAFKSLFDPNEKTKSGKVLPKAYLNSAREVVKTLRESLNEDPNDMAKFRRTADAAKASIHEYLGSWRGEKTVINEESYVVIVKAIRALASFYSKAGPSAPLPESVKSEIMSNLDTADKFL
ncbi:unnamed protein product [Lactuca virosa]|uniref:Photosystem II D1 processing protein PSB27-H2, chloroplastic n=1 Tax=Lactuca virosa TaxID=75947 RepID=A0AAU9PHP4_9ASTR|nr:unnamed protein product [Lactuca virosa]